MNDRNLKQLADQIKVWGTELGFSRVGIADIDLENAGDRLIQWLKMDFHGEMTYMQRHGEKRFRPSDLVSDTLRVITVQMDYLNQPMAEAQTVLEDPKKAYVSRYALGRDYHKLMRNRLQKLANRIGNEVGEFGYRAFCDSAPVMEKPLAEKSGQGWMGKHTNIINRQSGSWFFLGELYTDIPFPVDQPVTNHCGSCTACIDICPTRAIVAPYVLDARKCISYLTIEHRGAIPEELRKPIGNRIYGCDDCQLVCPWNRYAKITKEQDFDTRNDLDNASLTALFQWDEKTFLINTQGSAIRRIGFESWQRNIAVALGNAPSDSETIRLLKDNLNHPSELVREHVQWALNQHNQEANLENEQT